MFDRYDKNRSHGKSFVTLLGPGANEMFLTADSGGTGMIAKRSMSRRLILLASCTALPFSMAQVARADEPQDKPVEEVVVTASKRSESIQVVPAAVSAVSSGTLEDLHATQLTDFSAYVPSLQVSPGGSPGQTTISIRGIAPIGAGPTVGTYIDDTPVGSSSAYAAAISFALDLLPYDVQRVEVLRGPQGTLYGASSMGGLLKYVLTEPSLESFDVRVGADTFVMADASKPGGGARASISGPLIDGKLGVTASYAEESTPGFIDNPALGLTDQNGYRQQSARLGLLYEPDDALSVKLNALYQRTDASGDGNVALDATTLQPIVGSRSDNNLTSQPFRKYIQYYSADIEYKMSWADLVSASSYTDSGTSQTTDDSYIWGIAFPALGLPFAGLSQNQYLLHLDKYTQEFRLQSHPDTTFEWLAGVFSTYEKSTNFQSPSALTPDGTPIAGVNPIYSAWLPSTYTENAVFGDATLHITDKWEVFGGIRYSQNYQVFSTIGTSEVIPDVNNRNNKSGDSVVTFNAGSRYRFTDDVMAYVRVASGYQPGGPNLAVAGAAPTFQPDTLTNYELGLKSQFFNKKLLFDIDAFYIDWNNIQLVTDGAGFSYVANGGTAKSQGIEMNSTFRPLDGLVLESTFSYVDADLTQDAPAIGGVSGDRLPNIPRLSGSVRATYSEELSNGWLGKVGAGVRAQSDRVSDVNHAVDSRPLPGYAVLDLNAAAVISNYTISLYARNVTDRRTAQTYFPLYNQATGAISQIEATVLQPRVVGLSIDANF